MDVGRADGFDVGGAPAAAVADVPIEATLPAREGLVDDDVGRASPLPGNLDLVAPSSLVVPLLTRPEALFSATVGILELDCVLPCLGATTVPALFKPMPMPVTSLSSATRPITLLPAVTDPDPELAVVLAVSARGRDVYPISPGVWMAASSRAEAASRPNAMVVFGRGALVGEAMREMEALASVPGRMRRERLLFGSVAIVGVEGGGFIGGLELVGVW
jgi:hypothetical protein